ncbi:MAG: hypothetical protein AB8G22_20110 [Saprospiraceae bacterium]
MNKLKLFFYLFHFFLASNAFAQLTASNEFSLSLGATNFSLLDQHASPLVYQMTAPSIGFHFSKNKPQWRWEIEAQATLGNLQIQRDDLAFNLTNRFFQPRTSMFHLQYGWLKNVVKKDKFQTYLGGKLRYEFWQDFDSVANWAWGIGQGSLQLAGRQEFILKNEQQITLELAIPIVGLITRLPYNLIPRIPDQSPGVASFFATGTRLTSLHQYRSLFFNIGYQKALNERWQVGLKIQTDLYYYELPAPVRARQQQLQLNLTYRWSN